MNSTRKVAVITGASQGIGAGLVGGFLERGYRVVANSRSIKPDSSDNILTGFFHVSQRAIRQMLANGGGHVVNITTTLVNQPVRGVPAVLASLTKGGLDAVTRSLAIEYADKGIRVNAVAPGIIKTPMRLLKRIPSSLA